MRSIPDELLVSILCLLSFKEATATSILDRRWRYLHTWTRKLDLERKDSLLKIGHKEDKEKEERCKYVRWVDSVVGRHQSSTLEEFRLVFNLDRSHTDSIDSWLRFAVSRKVENLELNLTDCVASRSRAYHECYNFPYKNGYEFRFIRKLCTNYVNVSGKVVRSLLRDCPLLEHLSVSQSGDLWYLEITNTFPSFKCLEINLCHNLESVVIRDSNLVSLKMNMGIRKRIQEKDFIVENVPLLTEIWTYVDVVYLFSGVLPQIEMLKLYIRGDPSEERGGNFCLDNLKQFTVVDTTERCKHSLLPLINLIKASHRLQRFVLEAPLFQDDSNAAMEYIPVPVPRKKGRARPRRYPSLKEVKLVVNGCLSRQFKMVMHLVENGVALKHIIVDSRGVKYDLDYLRWDFFIPQTKINNNVLAMARALEALVPSTINVTII